MGSIYETKTELDVKPDLDFVHCSETLCNFRSVIPSKLYRSARVDAASIDDIQRLKERGIRTIIDLRSSNEAKTLGLDGKSFIILERCKAWVNFSKNSRNSPGEAVNPITNE